ncbi:MAG: polyprenyl synthetase family protein [Actinomycetaceae bacterium]|nr:polyprenyl synthetase family protein [Actinomycetaceae bacterium]MDY6083078.1 polyprenyl synthetase family protein [Actinomycetaceae bacterium]
MDDRQRQMLHRFTTDVTRFTHEFVSSEADAILGCESSDLISHQSGATSALGHASGDNGTKTAARSADTQAHPADPTTGEERASIKSFIAPALDLLNGGKHLRTLLVWAGYAAYTPVTDGAYTLLVHLGSALELFHTSALIHDDVIDASPLRRGRPSAQVQLAQLAQHHRWEKPQKFGTSAAIQLGDFMLSTAFSALADASALLPSNTTGSVMSIFSRMTAEVAYGQYLDIAAESEPLPPTDAHANQDQLGSATLHSAALQRARQVIAHKSVSYSTAGPLDLGAAAAGATEEQREDLRRFSTPLGYAFQLRDDALGLFGDPQETGKSSSSDFQEGKRTALLMIARAHLSQPDVAWIDSHIGHPLSVEDQQHASSLIYSAAFDEHEHMITRLEHRAIQELDTLNIRHQAADFLRELTHEMHHRTK